MEATDAVCADMKTYAFARVRTTVKLIVVRRCDAVRISRFELYRSYRRWNFGPTLRLANFQRSPSSEARHHRSNRDEGQGKENQAPRRVLPGSFGRWFRHGEQLVIGAEVRLVSLDEVCCQCTRERDWFRYYLRSELRVIRDQRCVLGKST